MPTNPPSEPQGGTQAPLPPELAEALMGLTACGFPIARISRIPPSIFPGVWIVGAYDETPGRRRLAHGEGQTSLEAARAALEHAKAGGEPLVAPLDEPAPPPASTLTPLEEQYQAEQRKKRTAKYRRERPDPARKRPPSRRREG